MPFQKGQEKKGGKKKGYTAEPVRKAQEIFTLIIEGQSEHIGEALEAVRMESPAKYLDVLAKLMPFVMPKKTEVDASINMVGAVIDWSENSTKASSATAKTK